MRKFLYILVILFLSAMIGCSNNGKGSSKTAPTPDTNPLTPDITGPNVENVVAVSENQVVVYFSEQIEESSAVDTENYIITKDSGSISLSTLELDNEKSGVLITLDSQMQYNTEYECFVKGVKDTSGNEMNSIKVSFDGRGKVLAVISDKPSSITNNIEINAAVAGTDVVSYKYKIDDDDWSSEREVDQVLSKTGLAEGVHTVYVIAKDSVDNWQPQNAPTIYSWTIDTTPPAPVFDNLPLNITADSNINVIVSGAYAYKYKIDGEAFTDEMSGPIERSDLVDGEHVLTAYARDAAGNWQDESAAITYTWEINTIDPVAELSGQPNLVTRMNSATIYVSGTGVIAYKYSIDGSGYGSEIDVSIPVTLVGLGEASHEIKVIGKTSAGVWQEQASETEYSWTIDMTPPVAEFVVKESSPSSLTEPIFSVGGDDVAGYKYRIDSGNWSTLYMTGGNIPLPELEEGEHTIEIIGRDSVGNLQLEGSAESYTWEIDLTAPSAVFVEESKPVSLTNSQIENLIVDNAEITAYKYKLDSEDWSDEFDISQPNINLDSILLTEGDHEIKLIGRDEAGNWQKLTDATSYSWEIDITPPQVIMVNLPSNPSGNAAASINVSGVEAVSYQYRVNGGLWESNLISDPIVLSGLSETENTVEVVGVDEAGNVQITAVEYSWTVDLTAETAVLSNLPLQNSNSKLAEIIVGGDGVTNYKYNIDDGGWLTETNVISAISLSELEEGAHNIKVIAKDSAGNWQEESNATEYSWNVDTIAPASEISGYPDVPVNDGDVDITVSGTDVVSYSYSINGGVWSGETTVSNIIDLSLEEGEYTIAVIGKDIAGNWQSAALSTNASIIIDQSPPTVPVVIDEGPSQQFNDILFSWSNNADIADVKIQISTDEGFGNIVYGGTDGALIGDLDSYTYGSEDSAGSEYYARIKVSDSAGNWSDFGTASDGIILTGSIVINVKDTNINILSGATAALKKTVESVTTEIGTRSADSNGQVLFNNIQTTTGDEKYFIEVSAAGFNSATKNNVSVNTGDESNQGIIYLTPESASPGAFNGQVINANDGSGITGATVNILDWNGSIVDTIDSGSGGAFTSNTLNPGTYSLQIAYDNFFDLVIDNMTIDGGTNVGKLSICEQLPPYQLRVVLLWGDSPKDLDLHLVGPSNNTVSGDSPANNRFHIFWRNQKSFIESTASYNAGADPNGDFATASLVQDATNMYGPEAINLFKLADNTIYANGTYTFTVHRWTSDASWYDAPITMRIYDSEGLWQEIPFPSGADDSHRYWQAFQINVQGQTRNDRSIEIVNNFVTLSYLEKDSMDWEVAPGGAAGFFLAVAHGDLKAIAVLFALVLLILAISIIVNKRRLNQLKS